MSSRPPSVLCLSGLDPSGGAGLQADCATLTALGVHSFAIVTALTVQDSSDVRQVVAVDRKLFVAQLECLLADCRPDAIKIGLVAAPALFPAVVAAIERLKVPVVLDPVLRAGGGTELAAEGYAAALRSGLLPHASVATPNAFEARRLEPSAGSLDAAAEALVASGCGNLLVTGGDEATAEVVNTLHRAGVAPRRFIWPRLPVRFHGAGCTLAAAIAGFLARGFAIESAVEAAQCWTQQALAGSYKIGAGREIPRRLAR